MWTHHFHTTRKATATVAAVAAACLAVAAPALAAEGGQQGDSPGDQKGSASGQPVGEAASGVWTPKEVNFVYMGFTSKYSCDGLVDKVRYVLLALGARKDLVVYGTGCAVSYGRPAPLPGVMIRMNVLQPADPAAASDSTAVPAHWKALQLKMDPDPVTESGECELVEQIKQKLLPLFATRDVEFKPNCVPHQLSPNGARLFAHVLIADKNERQASASSAHR